MLNFANWSVYVLMQRFGCMERQLDREEVSSGFQEAETQQENRLCVIIKGQDRFADWLPCPFTVNARLPQKPLMFQTSGEMG